MASANVEAIISGKTMKLLVVHPHYDVEHNEESLPEFKESLKLIEEWFKSFNSDGCVRTLSHECVILNLDSYLL